MFLSSESTLLRGKAFQSEVRDLQGFSFHSPLLRRSLRRSVTMATVTTTTVTSTFATGKIQVRTTTESTAEPTTVPPAGRPPPPHPSHQSDRPQPLPSIILYELGQTRSARVSRHHRKATHRDRHPDRKRATCEKGTANATTPPSQVYDQNWFSPGTGTMDASRMQT